MTKWKVTIQLYFIRTNFDVTRKEEPNPTKKQLDNYMREEEVLHYRKEPRYKNYVYDMYFEDDEYLTEIEYSDGGKISYVLDGRIYLFRVEDLFGVGGLPTAESVKQDIMKMSFEDTMYKGRPPSHAVYPTKNKYDGAYEELGVIDCRKKASISVRKKIF